MTRRTEALAAAALLFCGCTEARPRAAATPSPAVAANTPTGIADARAVNGDRSKGEPRVSGGEAIPEAVHERPPGLTDLDVPGFQAAVVSFPPSAAFPQPVLIATHGAGDTPAEMCDLWRALLGDRGVVLCPAGPRMRAHEEGRYYPDHHALERITFASLSTLREKYPDVADTEHAVYTGYSQGATMGALMIPPYGGECPRLVLVEGGFGDWSMERATTFARAGGRRTLFVCGRQQCKEGAERSAAWLRKAGVPARVVSHVGEGHVIHVAEAATPELGWLLDGDPRWTPSPKEDAQE